MENKMTGVNIYMQDYIYSLYGNNKSKDTTDNYLSDLKFYQKWLKENDITITEVNLQHLNVFKVYLRNYKMSNGKLYAPRTIAKRVTVVKEFYNYLHEMDIISINPAIKMTIPDIPKNQKPIYMKEEDISKLIKATEGSTHGVRDKAILVTFISTGLRLSELRSLNIEDIDGKLVTIHHGKGNKERKVYLNSTCIESINKYLKTRTDFNEALFISERINRLSVNSINYMLRKYLAKAKLSDKYTIHKLRHTAASLMLTNGVGIRVIQEVLGHESLATTQKYTHVLDKDLQNAAKTLEGIF